MLFSLVYWGIAVATFEAMGENGRMPATLAPWVGNVAFALFAGVLLRLVKR